MGISSALKGSCVIMADENRFRANVGTILVVQIDDIVIVASSNSYGQWPV